MKGNFGSGGGRNSGPYGEFRTKLHLRNFLRILSLELTPPLSPQVDMGLAQEEVEVMVEALVVDDIKSFKGLCLQYFYNCNCVLRCPLGKVSSTWLTNICTKICGSLRGSV